MKNSSQEKTYTKKPLPSYRTLRGPCLKTLSEFTHFSYRLYYKKKSLLCFRLMSCVFMLKAVFTCKTLLTVIKCLQESCLALT